MPFEVFDKRAVPLHKRPQVTLQRRGIISFNAPAYQAIGSPEAVHLLYDSEERLIGLRPVSPEDPHAYGVRAQNSGHTYLVSGTAFVNHYAIPTPESVRYDAIVRDGILIVDLKGEGAQVVSNRKRGSDASAEHVEEGLDGSRPTIGVPASS